MGTWSIPWETLEIAQEFAGRMAAPWTAVVQKVERPDFGPLQAGDELQAGGDGTMLLIRDGKEVPPIGTTPGIDWEAERLYELCGDDELFDDLGDAADELQEDFDVREYVKHWLGELLPEIEEEITAEERPAMNVVRKAVGLEPLS